MCQISNRLFNALIRFNEDIDNKVVVTYRLTRTLDILFHRSLNALLAAPLSKIDIGTQFDTIAFFRIETIEIVQTELKEDNNMLRIHPPHPFYVLAMKPDPTTSDIDWVIPVYVGGGGGGGGGLSHNNSNNVSIMSLVGCFGLPIPISTHWRELVSF